MSAGYDDTFFAITAAVELTHFWYRSRREVIAGAIRRLAGRIRPGARIAELGCGNGSMLPVLARELPGSWVVGLDAYTGGLEDIRRGSDRPVVQANAGALPLRRSLSLVACFDVLEHLDDDTAALSAIQGALIDPGLLVLTVPARQSLWSDFDEASGHRRRYERSGLSQLLASAGFTIEYMTGFMVPLYPIARLTRRRGEGRDARAVVAGELHISRWANRLAYAALAPERVAVRRGRSLPTGTSLLAVASARS